MRFKDFITEQMFDHSSTEHQKYMADVDAFTASPGVTLKPDTIKYLKSKQVTTQNMTLYRVLFTSDLNKLAKELDIGELKVGAHGTHHAKRVSSWSTSKSVVLGLVADNDDLGDYAVVLKADIPGDSIVLDTSNLTTADKEHIYLFDQKEVIVDEGSYPISIIDVIDYNNY